MKVPAMAHERFEFEMPASCEVVFDAFHYHQWRSRWDSLVSRTHVVGNAPCPYVGAVTENTDGGWMRILSMKTQFVSYNRPHVAAATMLGRSFPFARWSASMQHKALDGERSVMIYTYTFEAAPSDAEVDAYHFQRAAGRNGFRQCVLSLFHSSHAQYGRDSRSDSSRCTCRFLVHYASSNCSAAYRLCHAFDGGIFIESAMAALDAGPVHFGRRMLASRRLAANENVRDGTQCRSE